MKIICKFTNGERASILYTNWEGRTANRFIQLNHIWFGITGFHNEPQFLLNAIDLDKNVIRDFAMKDIGDINIHESSFKLEDYFVRNK